jgi:hypothetical protein
MWVVPKRDRGANRERLRVKPFIRAPLAEPGREFEAPWVLAVGRGGCRRPHRNRNSLNVCRLEGLGRRC